MRLKVFLTFICCLIGLNSIFAQDAGFMTNVYGRNHQLLNGKWSVIVDQYDLGEGMQIYKDRKPAGDTQFFEYSFEGGPRLNVPGDWNSQMPELKYYEGTLWYARHFNAERTAGKRQFLYFGGVTYRCRIYLNGEEIASHEGSFTPFQVEVSDLLNNGDNYLVVMVNNRRTKDAIPAMNFDWWNYGGITRDVMLIETPDVYISDYFVRLSSEDRKSVDVSVKLSSPTAADVKIEIPLLNISQTVRTGENGEVSVNLAAKNLRLWAPDDPHLYYVTLSCGQDIISEEIGFRYLETRGSEILVNGKPVFMRGVNFHEEIASRQGRAVSEDDAYMLLSEAKALGVNMVRLAHYPQNEHTVRLAEKMGIVLWEEIPVWQGIDFEDMDTKAKALNMLSEMINRDKNRCAICFFSISNETAPSDARNAFLTELLEWGKSLDSTRLFTSAFNYTFRYDEESGKCVMDDPFMEKLDVIGVNRYMGWYAPWPVEPSQMVWDVLPDKPLIVSEFGGEALYGQHGEGKAASEWSEEYQANVYRDNIKMFNSIPNLAGVCPWILFDFQTPFRMNQINQMGWNRKGLVSERGDRKQAWYVMHEYYEKIMNKEKETPEPRKIGIVAHRGYWNCEEAGYARNSLAALRCAQEYGFWGTEFDLHLTTDEVIIIVHDDEVNGKRIDANPYSEFADFTLENGEKIPTIDDFLAQAVKCPKTMLVCEFKSHATTEIEDRLMELTFAKLKEYGLYDPKRIMFVSFSRRICDYIANEMPEFDVECVGNDYDPDDLASTNIKGVNYEYHTFDNNPTWLDMVRANGMRLKVWNPNTREDMKRMVGINPDFISSDEPLLLRTVLKEIDVEEL